MLPALAACNQPCLQLEPGAAWAELSPPLPGPLSPEHPWLHPKLQQPLPPCWAPGVLDLSSAGGGKTEESRGASGRLPRQGEAQPQLWVLWGGRNRWTFAVLGWGLASAKLDLECWALKGAGEAQSPRVWRGAWGRPAPPLGSGHFVGFKSKSSNSASTSSSTESHLQNCQRPAIPPTPKGPDPKAGAGPPHATVSYQEPPSPRASARL